MAVLVLPAGLALGRDRRYALTAVEWLAAGEELVVRTARTAVTRRV